MNKFAFKKMRKPNKNNSKIDALKLKQVPLPLFNKIFHNIRKTGTKEIREDC